MNKILRKDPNDETIYLTAPVMIPGAEDCDAVNGEPALTVDQIRAFKESYDQYGFVDSEHSLTRDGRKIGEPVESVLLSEPTSYETIDNDLREYPEGTWLLTTHIVDDEAISEAKKGYYTGYSPSILPRNRADEYYEALKSGEVQLNSMGSALIKDVPDPVVLSVSLTHQPCLHESKFCKIRKENDNMKEEDISLKSKVLAAIGMSEEAEVVALKAEVSNLQEELEKMETGFQEALSSMQEEFKQTLNEALTPVSEVVANKSEEETAEEEEEPVEEEVEEEVGEVAAEKGESKAEPVHDNIAEKASKPKSIYEVLGRNPNGTIKRGV